MKNTKNWKEYCKQCGKYHIVNLQSCPSCGVYETPQPVSEKIRYKHLYTKYECDGCESNIIKGR